MIDHMGFRVRDLKAARRFYDAAMGVLGLSVIDNSAESFLIAPNAENPIPFVWVPAIFCRMLMLTEFP